MSCRKKSTKKSVISTPDSSTTADDYERMIDSKRKIQLSWNLKFINQRKEQLYWRSFVSSQSATFSTVIFSVLFLFVIERFLLSLIDDFHLIDKLIFEDRSLDCINCVAGTCKAEVNFPYSPVPLTRPLNSRFKVVPNYQIIPMQYSTFEKDNICPEDTKYDDAIKWLTGLNTEAATMLVSTVETIKESRGCSLLITGLFNNGDYQEDITIFGIFLLILLIQVTSTVWGHSFESTNNNYNHWDSGYNYVEREQDKIRSKVRDQIRVSTSIRSSIHAENYYRNFYDISEANGISDEVDAPRKLFNLKHAIKVFLCYTAYTISVLNPILSLHGSARFSGGLLNNSQCRDGEYDLNYAPLFVKGTNAGVHEAIFTWSQHGFKYVFGITAIHFSGAVRFATLLPVSLFFIIVTLSTFIFSVEKTAEGRVALFVLPLIHLVYLVVVYQVEYTERLMWDLQRNTTKTTINQRKVCEDMLPKATLKAILKDSLDLAYRNDHVTFLFSDIVGFTNFSDKVDAGQVLQLLQSLFVHFDFMVSYYGLFKVCTIGDAYVAITQPTNASGRKERNITLEDIQGFADILQFGYTMLKRVVDVKTTLKIKESKAKLQENNALGDSSLPSEDLKLVDLAILAMRIGLHHGTCVGGIIGSGRIRYDIWGVDVLIGECMEQNGDAMEIHVSENWRQFFTSYPVTTVLNMNTIEDAGEFPMREITFEYKGVNRLKIDDLGNLDLNEPKKDSVKDVKGYILRPSWSEMMEIMEDLHEDKISPQITHRSILASDDYPFSDYTERDLNEMADQSLELKPQNNADKRHIYFSSITSSYKNTPYIEDDDVNQKYNNIGNAYLETFESGVSDYNVNDWKSDSQLNDFLLPETSSCSE